MDLGTIIGLAVSNVIILMAIILGGSAGIFVNIPSILIVVGGTFGVTFIKYPLGTTLGSMKVALKAFFHQGEPQIQLIEQAVQLAAIARQQGLLGLESIEINNKFLHKGVQLAVDGQDPEFVRRILTSDINLTIERHDTGQHIFKGIGESAPAMGMIGTLVGLVQMMSNLSDPSSLGPAMAVALLTTLYGAVIANVICLPIADKLAHRSTEERINKSLILETVNGLQNGVNPRVLEELLKTYLPGAERFEGSILDKS